MNNHTHTFIERVIDGEFIEVCFFCGLHGKQIDSNEAYDNETQEQGIEMGGGELYE